MSLYRRLLFSALTAVVPLRAISAESVPATVPAEKPLTSVERLAWFHEAKFGLFIHWGLYSIPAGEWKGERITGIGEWIMNHAKIPVQEYADLAKQFNPTKFDAEAWAQMAQDAGMKYVVITSKHHDGFALFKSAVSPFNVVDATPFKRDIIQELSTACARHGLRFGVYYSQAQDWHEPNGIGNTWDFGPDEKKNVDQYLREKAEPQVKELLTNYGPICLIWFDTPKMMTPQRGQRFAEIVRTLQPACLIDGRLGTEGDYRSTGDNSIPTKVQSGAWETPATINHTWGYKADDHDWKSPGEITFKLVDIVSKGGNYLLNVGPMSNGLIPQPSQDNLRAVGDWLKVNGEAVYGAGPTPFGDELGETSAKAKDAKGRPVFLTRNDWRVTTKPGKLYFTFFKWPGDRFPLPVFKNSIKGVRLLGQTKADAVSVATKDGTAFLQLPREPVDPMATVVCLEIEGETVQL